MAKLCAKGKATAKRKFKVYPSAYANMYASGVCSGRIKHHSKKHMTEMKSAMKKGKTFTQAHKVAMKKVGK